jgi:hypothetical protein
MKEYIKVPPKPKMGESLCALGYKATTAAADIADNSIDANATEIVIEASGASNQSDPVNNIDIFDNGCGMNREQLINALTLGSDTNKGVGALGCFGMGLKTAGNSIGRRITVMTKEIEGEVITMTADLDVNLKEGGYVLDEDPSHITGEQRTKFDAYVSKTGCGTWVYIDKIHSTEYINVKTFLSALKSERSLRLYFRKFLDSGKHTIKVNSCELKPWGYDYCEGVETIAEPFNFVLKDGTNLGTLKIINTLDSEHKPGHARSQGLVVVRNNRDITTDKVHWHGVYAHNWELSGVHVIWEVEASVFDQYMQTTLMKNGWHLPQNIRDSLTAEISSDLQTHIKNRQAKRTSEDSSDESKLEDVTSTYNNNLNNNMNVTASPEVFNENAVPPKERAKAADDEKDTEDVPDPSARKPRKGKPFRFPQGQDEWIIDIDYGCGDGRYYQYHSERKRGGGRKFYVSIDNKHPWIEKAFCSQLADNSFAIFALYDALVGDVYMEMTCTDPEEADRMIRAKSEFLRTRAKVTAAHDKSPAKKAA